MLPHFSREKLLPPHRATYDDLLKVPDHLVAEIVDGVLYSSPRPAPKHAKAHSKLLAFLSKFEEDVNEPGGWNVFTEPELHFGEDIVVPDIGGWRIGHDPMETTTAYFTLAPHWVCEVLSPSTVRLDRLKKLRVYGREGIPHAWLVDPIARTLELFELTGGSLLLRGVHRDDARVRVTPFDAIEIGLSRLWTTVSSTQTETSGI